MLNFFAIVLVIFIGILLIVLKKRSIKNIDNKNNNNGILLPLNVIAKK